MYPFMVTISLLLAAAQILRINETDAIAMLILILVSVLEPLSIGLTVATSAAWAKKEAPSRQCLPQNAEDTDTDQ